MRRDNNPAPHMREIRSVSQEEFSAMHSKSYFAEHATDQKIRERYFPDFARMGVMVERGLSARK